MPAAEEAGRPRPAGGESKAPAGEWVRVPDRAHGDGAGGGRRPPRRRRRPLFALAVAAVALTAAAAGVYLAVSDYFSVGERGSEVSVTIPPDVSLGDIALILERAQVVPRAKAFQVRAERDGYAARFRPGTYALHVNEPYDDLVAALLEGGVAPMVRVTVPEGLSARQTADLLAKELPGFSAAKYVELTLERPLPFELRGFAAGGPLEGFLFPATYTVPPDISERRFIELQLDAFSKTLAAIDRRKAQGHNLSDYDITILGSMVEREIQVADERALAAAVMWRRLRIGMPLQIDATVQYALPAYKEQLTYDDLKVQSPYNTYLHTGLPPTPIANPGAAALSAAAHPAAVDYLYYVARNDGSGRHYFSSNYAQFLEDKERAQQ